ncbi:unnamed protein product [Schistosoma rodhaini]|uniref:Uncharacterized protein n=1 Tax=Schistosoma rodhaini TaxID=6188 RepID=A0AA85F9U1_9TREM|nr:unnamed protein product [Schistosoma rodhaini]
MLTVSRISVFYNPFLQISNGVSACRGNTYFSRYTKRSRKASEFNFYRNAAEIVETSFSGENFEKSVSEMRHAKFVERQKHKFSVLQKKYSNNPVELSVLTWKAKEQIMFLLNCDESMDFEQISNSFPITSQGAEKLFGNKPSYVLQKSGDISFLLKHDSHVIERWNHLLLFLNRIYRGGNDVAESSVFGMIPSGLSWLCTNAKMNLLMYADGNPKLPFPKSHSEIVKEDHSHGHFEIYAAAFNTMPKDEFCDRYAQHVLRLRKFVETFQKLQNSPPQNVPLSGDYHSLQLYKYLLSCATAVNSKCINQRSISLPNNVKLRDYYTKQKI